MKTVAVVCDEKTRKYATYLSQLIMQKDDSENNIVGVKDGEVNMTILSEKEYRDSKLSSSQYVVFFGNSDIAKECRAHMKPRYEKFGMKYAWLGHQCALYVENDVRRKEYDDFLDYAKKYQDDVKNARESVLSSLVKDAAVVSTGIGAEALGLAAGTAYVAGGSAILGILAAPIFLPVGTIAGGGLLLNKARSFLKEKKAIRDQQYCCLTLVYYLKGLNEFLNQ